MPGPVDAVSSILERLKNQGASQETVSDLEVAMEDLVSALKEGHAGRAAAAFKSAVQIASSEPAEDPKASA